MKSDIQDRIKRDVLSFIGRFSYNCSEERWQVVECFTEGCCYWFAFILYNRFKDEFPCDIMISYISNHFGCKVGEEIYDITGIVSSIYEWKRWSECDDTELKKRINEYCINF